MRADVPRNVVRFDGFEVDLDSGELRRDGARIPLGEQPTQVLLALLRRPGTLVTRDELRAALWPAHTFVEDADQGLNAAVKRLRDALEDSAEEPRFIETVPRRGYRFVGAMQGRTPGPTGRATPQEPPRTERHSERLPWRRLRLVTYMTAAVALAVLASLAAILLRRADDRRLAVRATSPRVLTEDSVNLPPFWMQIALVANGPLLYFAENVDGVRTRIVPTAGGVSQRLDFGLSWSEVVEAASPDGSELIVTTHPEPGTTVRPFWIVSTAGGAPRRLGNISGHSPLWLQDGRIVYLKGFGTVALCITDRDGTTDRTVTSFHGQAYWPRLAPDGTRVRLTLNDEFGRWSLVDVDLGTAASKPVAFAGRELENPCCGSWTPDGRVFVFQASRGLETHLWAAPERGDAAGAPTQITDGPVYYRRPLPSPDGRRLFAVGWHLKGELVHFDRHAGKFLPHPLGLSAEWVEFSRDGRSVAYVTYPKRELWISRSDGTQKLRLGNAPALNVHWSPDGSAIVYNEVHGRDWRMVRLSRDGGGRLDLGVGNNPSWSPDGKAVAFSSEEGGGKAPGIYVRDLDDGSERLIPDSGPFFAPRWSPDGRFIAAQGGGDPALALYDVARQRWSPLVGGIAWYPTWSSDSSAIYYSAPTKGIVTDSIYRIPLSTRAPVLVWRSDEIRLVWGDPPVSVAWFGLDDRDRPLLLRDISTHDIYALDLAYDDK